MPVTVHSIGSEIDWLAFWQAFHQYALWDLEWYNGATWESRKQDLTVQHSFPEPNRCKIKLIFNASAAGNYRLTFAINKIVKNYIDKIDKFQYELTYDDLFVTFDWSDCANVSGLTFTHGVKDDYFWFRIRRDNIPLGAHVEIDPATVATSTSSSATANPVERKTFYAAGRYWAFYYDGSNIVYESTTDPTNWSGTVYTIGPVTNSGTDFSIFFDGTYVHYARHYNYDLFYRRGTPNSDGTITWSAVEQTVYDGSSSGYYCFPCISVDSSGYAWIGARYYNGSSYYPYAIKNANNDGTWSTASGFPYQLNATNHNGWKVGVARLTSQRMYIIYGRSGGAVPLGRLYDGGWGSEESNLGSYNLDDGNGFSLISEGDNVHFAYLRATTFEIHYNKRTYGSGWGTDTLVQSLSVGWSYPSLSIDTSTGTVYCFWMRNPTAGHIYYKKRVSGTWDSDPTDWINESADGFPSYGVHTAFFQAYDSKIGLLYMTKTASPYNVRFAYLTLGVLQEVTDSISLSESTLSNKTFLIVDSIGLTDIPLKHWTPQVTDSILLTDTTLRNKIFEILESVGLSDSVLSNKTLSVLDIISLSELIDATKGGILKEVLDSIGLTDQVLMNKTLIVMDALSLEEQTLISKQLLVVDQVKLSENAYVNKIMIISDQISLAETVEKTGAGGVKTKIFLLIGDLAIQVTG